jgi:ATPase subunit of ABC transporter with duplicated ATPase domains
VCQVQGQLRDGKSSKGAGAVSSRKTKLELIEIGATNKFENGKKYKQSYCFTHPPPLESVALELPPVLSLSVASDCSGVVLSLQDARIGIDGLVVLEHVEFSLSMGQRIGVLGKNGAGKSLFLKSLAAQLPLLSGTRLCCSGIRVFLFSQHVVEQFEDSFALSAIDYLMHKCNVASLDAARKRLGSVGLSGPQQTAHIATLSGGQKVIVFMAFSNIIFHIFSKKTKARLAFAVMSAYQPHVLLLGSLSIFLIVIFQFFSFFLSDEPSTFLDLLTIDALIECLCTLSCAVVIVTHDEYMQTCCTDFVVLQGKSLRQIKS